MDRDDIAASRRNALKEISGGLFLAAAGSAFAQAASTASSPPADAAAAFLPDFPTEYPRPPFAKQQQPWPGLASKMTPRPDHGETSYRGSGRLLGRKALITGGDSGMGRAAAIAFAREGADVAINYLPQEEPDAVEVMELVRRAGRKGVALPGDIRDEAFCTGLVEKAAADLGGLDIVVSNAARQVAQKSILDISSEQFDATFKTNVYAMFWILKAAVARMKPGSTIICTASINAYDPGADILGAKCPMGRPGQPAELAPLYVMLADNRASFTTGQIVGATGGESGP